jgi:hypothetical protein
MTIFVLTASHDCDPIKVRILLCVQELNFGYVQKAGQSGDNDVCYDVRAISNMI